MNAHKSCCQIQRENSSCRPRIMSWDSTSRKHLRQISQRLLLLCLSLHHLRLLPCSEDSTAVPLKTVAQGWESSVVSTRVTQNRSFYDRAASVIKWPMLTLFLSTQRPAQHQTRSSHLCSPSSPGNCVVLRWVSHRVTLAVTLNLQWTGQSLIRDIKLVRIT